MLKCVQHMPDVFSPDNLSVHYKILIGLKDQFDLHKVLQSFYEKKTCTLQLIFLLIFFGKDWRNSYFEDSEGGISCKKFWVKWSWQPLYQSLVSRAIFFFPKIIWCFLCFVDIFCYLKHSLLWPSESCLLGDCQLHNID